MAAGWIVQPMPWSAFVENPTFGSARAAICASRSCGSDSGGRAHHVLSCTKPKKSDGAAKASRQAVIICGNRHAYSSAVVLFAVFASP